MKLNQIANHLKQYYNNADDAVQVILKHAGIAAGACAVGIAFPALEVPAIIVASFGAVWAMYIQLCKCLGIELSDNLLKVLASAAISNITINLASAYALEVVASMLPGIGHITGTVLTFSCVYLAGMMFMSLLLALAKNGQKIEEMSEEELKSALREQTPTKEDMKDAKTAFKCEPKTAEAE